MTSQENQPRQKTIRHLKEQIRQERLQLIAGGLKALLNERFRETDRVLAMQVSWALEDDGSWLSRPYPKRVQLTLTSGREVVFAITAEDWGPEKDFWGDWTWTLMKYGQPSSLDHFESMACWNEFLDLLQEDVISRGGEMPISCRLPRPAGRAAQYEERREQLAERIEALKQQLRQERLALITEELTRVFGLTAPVKFLRIEAHRLDDGPVVEEVEVDLRDEDHNCWLFNDPGEAREARGEGWDEEAWDHERHAPKYVDELRDLDELRKLDCWAELIWMVQTDPDVGYDQIEYKIESRSGPADDRQTPTGRSPYTASSA